MFEFILNTFSNREIATGIWTVLIVILVLLNKKVRISIKRVFEAALSIKLIVPLLIIIAYTAAITFVFSIIPFYKTVFIKDIVIWSIFAGIPLYFGAITNHDKGYFKQILITNIKFIIIVEFILSSYTLGLIGEIILVPFASLIAITSAFSEYKKQTDIVKAANAIMAIIGFFILGIAIKGAINDITVIANYDSIISLLIPIVFSILYIPITYLFRLYAFYEQIFIRMKVMTDDNNKRLRKKKKKLVGVCLLSYKKLSYFNSIAWAPIYKNMPDENYDNLIEEVKSYKVKRS